MNYIYEKISLIGYVVLSFVLLTGCNAPFKPNEIQETIIETVTPIETLPPLDLNLEEPIAIPTTLLEEENTKVATNIPSPTPKSCLNLQSQLPKAFPTEIDMQFAKTATEYPYLYLAVEHHIGIFNITSERTPIFLGFWKLSNLSKTLDIEAKNGIIYVGSDSYLQTLTISQQCLLQTVSSKEIDLQVFNLELENSKLYVGGVFKNKQNRQILIYPNTDLQEEKDLIDLGENSLTWSIFNQNIYFFSKGELFFTDISNINTYQINSVNINLDANLLLISPAIVKRDRLYLLLQEGGGFKLTIVSNIKENIPTITQNPIGYHFGGFDVFDVQDNYIFIGNNGCDIDCASATDIIDINTGQSLVRMGFHPHYPIYKYQEVSKTIIYAFSNNSLLVMDISNLNESQIVGQIPFILD